MPKSLRSHTHLLDKRLTFRLRLYFVIAVILLLLFAYNVVMGNLRFDLGLLALGIGILLGIIASRIFHTSWSHGGQKVVSRLDRYGAVILILYIIFSLLRQKIVGYVTHGFEVGSISFAILAGVMFGRVIGMRGKIIEVLKKQKVFG